MKYSHSMNFEMSDSETSGLGGLFGAARSVIEKLVDLAAAQAERRMARFDKVGRKVENPLSRKAEKKAAHHR